MNDTPIQRLTKGDVADLIEQARHENNIPAMAVVVMDSERVVLSDIQGEREVGSNRKATLDNYFHIGSCAKSILAVMAGKLIEKYVQLHLQGLSGTDNYLRPGRQFTIDKKGFHSVW